ncbi:MAG: hypothetical protein HY319_18905 [Armatimonadetes bacterium]|nr:hypothetical protein [Armatimonadota bacterium]
MKARKRRAIVLITTLVLTVVIVMFVGAVLVLGPGNLAAGQNTLYQGDARRAAESGATYALSQLRENPNWRGDKNRVTVTLPDLYVEEDNGNVVGLVRTPGGSWAQFRLRFNYQDGPAGPDNLDDPVGLTIDHPFMSINNLTAGTSTPVPRADGPGYSVTPTSATPFETPVWSVCLAVQGTAGPGCGVLTPSNLDPPLGGAVSRQVVEAIFQVPDMGPVVEESGSMSGSDFTVTLRDANGQMEVKSNSASTPRVRSKGALSVTWGDPNNPAPGEYRSPNGEVRCLNSQTGGFTANYDDSTPGGVTVTDEAPVDPFYELAWADVKKADPAGPKLAAGTYVWWEDGSLHYYDMSYTDYVNFITQPANNLDPGVTPPPLPEEVIQVDPAKHKLTITDSIYVDPTGNNSEFNVVARLGSQEAPPGDPEAVSGNDVAIASAIASNPSLLFQVLNATQTTNMDWDYTTPTGSVDLDWALGASAFSGTSINGASITSSWTPAQAVELQNGLLLLAGIPVPGYTPNNPDGQRTPINLPALASQFSIAGGGGSPNNGTIPIPAVADSLSAADLEIEFAPPAGTLAVLTAESNVRLTAAIKGQGGSITSGGEIRITGLGAQFSANEQSGVNMYAVGDIVFSTLDQPSPGVYSYRDVNLKGVIYTQGDFIARVGSPALPDSWGKVNLEGCLIAYGGDPSGAPGVNGKGHVDIRAEAVSLAFDPVYLGSLSALLPAGFSLTPLSWSSH